MRAGSDLMNFKLLIQYDGTDFHGWQVQENDRSIQGELERVIGMLVDGKVTVHGSGRRCANWSSGVTV